MSRVHVLGCVAFLFLILAGCGSGDPGPETAPDVVTTEAGTARGIEEDGAHGFLGIPYAAPPTGSLRWVPPQPAEPWTQELHASSFSPICPQNWQTRVGGTEPLFVGEEDCLYLNVWTPSGREAGSRLPAMVFIHGGGNFTGSASEPMDNIIGIDDAPPAYHGARLSARGEVVVVTINYRLGALGFLHHDVLGLDPTGNLGILDQVTALEWIQRNIAAFGGDPDRVMLFGQSGGAYDTCIHLASPLSTGLFSRAMMQSGICHIHPSGRMEQFSADLVDEMGCADVADPLACMRERTPEELTTAKAALPLGLGSFTLHPYVDGHVVEHQPQEILANGEHNRVPFVIGTTAHEYAHRFEGVTEQTYAAALTSMLGAELAGEVAEVYPVAAYPTARDAMVAVMTDRNLTCSSRRIARAASGAQEEPVFRYHFRRVLSAPERLGDGAYHGTELLYVFQHMDGAAFAADDEDRAVESLLLGHWTRFAESGDPGGGDAAWPLFVDGEERFRVLDVTPGDDARLRQTECDFWDSIIP